MILTSDLSKASELVTGEALSNSNNNINKLAWPVLSQETSLTDQIAHNTSPVQARWVAETRLGRDNNQIFRNYKAQSRH